MPNASASGLVDATRALSAELDRMRFGKPVDCVYNPLDYARDAYEEYLSRYGRGPKEAVFVGMNPGPWGMAQTGVPFGDVKKVTAWLGISGAVGRPKVLHPKRPIHGFDCKRSEASGTRLWGWAERRFGPAEKFFDRFFVLNYCPLLFFAESGANITPDKIARGDQPKLYEACDEALLRAVSVLKPRFVIGIGKFAAERVEKSLEGYAAVKARVTHPSPANPAANRGWEPLVERELAAAGLPL